MGQPGTHPGLPPNPHPAQCAPSTPSLWQWTLFLLGVGLAGSPGPCGSGSIVCVPSYEVSPHCSAWEVTCTPCGYVEIPCKAVNVTCSSLGVLLRNLLPALSRLSLLSRRGRGVSGLALPSHPHPRSGEFIPAGPGHSPHSHTPWPFHWVSESSLGLGEDRAFWNLKGATE